MTKHDISPFTGPPLIGLCADWRTIDGSPFHAVGDKYLRAVAEAAGGVPFIIPALSEFLPPRELVQRIDGLVLTGSPSNVHPRHYGGSASREAEPYDEPRDRLTLPLIDAVLEAGLPMLAICRGFQELNVALGGTLHASLHQEPGRIDHRQPEDDDMDVRYGPRHGMRFVAGGAFQRIANAEEIQVNSLHRQGVDRLSDQLVAEGTAPDGTIEAVRVKDASGFALGVQWHPEYKPLENEFSARLFAAFSEATRAYTEGRKVEIDSASMATES